MDPTTCEQPARPLLIGCAAIESLGKDYALTEEQVECLHNMSFLASNCGDPGEITVPQLAVSLMSMAVTFSCSNGRLEENRDLHRLISRMQLQLDQHLTLTRPMNKTLRSEARNLLYNPARTTHCNLGEDLYVHIAADPATFGFAEFFETPAKAASLASKCDGFAKDVRGALKHVIVESLLHNKDLDRLTIELNKSDVGGSAQYNEHAVRIRNAFLRRVFVENPVLLLGFEPGEGPEWKKRKRATGERLLHKHEYWAVVDEWYEEKIKAWGTDMTQRGWKEYIEETLQKEKAGYANGLAIGITLTSNPTRSDASMGTPLNGTGGFIHAMTGGL
ncbi:hypothetical protein V5O48_014755 [Marasmius crinis-equi]|uniref:Uncharacterized protein n=1 Tax=Marasmius crinis-equi TaxID=585013 RepID=A0ABR3EWF2_9AGAR